MDALYSSRNPYDEAELFALLERMRRKDELDAEMDRELGELLIAVTKYAMTCGIRRGICFDGEDALSRCTVYALEASRKGDPSNAHSYVSYMVSAVQRNWMRDSMTDANRRKLLLPAGTEGEVELSAGIDGNAEGIAPWERIRIYTTKHKEATDGRKASGRRNRRSEEGTGNPDRDSRGS